MDVLLHLIVLTTTIGLVQLRHAHKGSLFVSSEHKAFTILPELSTDCNISWVHAKNQRVFPTNDLLKIVR